MITEHLLELSRERPPEPARRMMQLCLLDWSACAIAGAREQDFKGLVAQQVASGSGPAQLVGGGALSAPAAALVNGTLSHALDYDDTHFAHIGHPSVAIVPAVLALAEGSFQDAVDAAAIGIEASIRVGIWLGRGHYQIGFHQTATAGAFGATLAAGRILGLDDRQLRHALGLCASMASGIKAQFGTMAKPLNAGLAARSGVEAALWARAGMTAAQDGLAGPLGFGATHHGEGGTALRVQSDWHILDISQKFHACCHGLHAMLEALGDVRLSAGEIDRIEIRTHPRWMSVCNIAEPRTGLAAKFSYAQTAAMRMSGYDTGDILSYTDAITRDPDIEAIRSRVHVSEDQNLTETQCEVAITRTSGETTRHGHDLMAPMTLEVRTGKVRAKVTALLGREPAAELWRIVQRDDLPKLMAVLQAS